jgi:hypothetical protein
MKALIASACIVLLMFSFSFSQTDTSAKPGSTLITVDSMAFAAGIDARAPMGIATEFESTTEKVSCWTRVSSSQGPVSVKHVWYKDDNKVFELPLTLTSQSGRLWSTKSVSSGNWRVDVVDDAGNVVTFGSFVVR